MERVLPQAANVEMRGYREPSGGAGALDLQTESGARRRATRACFPVGRPRGTNRWTAPTPIALIGFRRRDCPGMSQALLPGVLSKKGRDLRGGSALAPARVVTPDLTLVYVLVLSLIGAWAAEAPPDLPHAAA